MTFRQGSFRLRPVWTGRRILGRVALFAVVGALLALCNQPSVQESIASLISAPKRDARPIESRLSGGLPWAPFRSPRRDALPRSGVFASAIGTSQANLRGEASEAEGVAQLLARHPKSALSSLTAAAERSNSSAAWNDLAAGLLEVARRDEAPELLADSLEACDRALSQQPRFPEALFNRAIVLERLGLRDDAREAWEQYLAADSTSDWAAEARTHRDALPPEEPFLTRLDREYERVKNDPAAAMALVKRDPFGARGTAVMVVLGRWGKAVLDHDDIQADRHRSVARQLGAAVALAQGDRLLERAVAVIDAASGEKRALLASAHSDYQDGQKANKANRPVDAEALFRRAADAFETAQSPMALPARVFAANMAFAQGRRKEARHDLEVLLPTVSEDFPGYRTIVLKELGRYHVALADWGIAISMLEGTESLFDRLGEPKNASEVRRLLAFVYDQIGDPGNAWKYRRAALRGLGGQTCLELSKGVASITDAAMLRHEWRTALSFLTIELRIAHRLQDDFQLANIPLVRAVVRDRLGDEAGALTDIADAEQAMPRTKDPAYRTYLGVAARRASAMLSSTPPAKADALLTEAIEFQSAKSDALKLPSLFLERARARRKSGNAEGAMADVKRGIALLEEHRQSLPEGESRWGAFHAAEELFEEGIDQALSIDDTEAAFRFAERARARSLLDSYKRPPVLDYRRLPRGTVVVEYVSLPSRLVIFTADASGVRATTEDYPREKVIAEVDELVTSLRQTGSVVPSAQAAALYRRLIEPVEVDLLGATTVVFVPDRATSTVSFSALTNSRGQYLVEEHAIVVAASAAAYVAAAERRGEAIAPRTALVISASDPGAGGRALTFADAEARHVAKAYRSATLLRDDAAQLDALMKQAPEADAIHFAGHAIGDDRGIEPASMVLRQDGHERRVGVAEIAKLHLRPSSVVVLAGCSTARGERRAAEGVISVAHGFLSAGAPSVIATLWPIDDEAASIFFPRLHEKLAQGLSAAEALREAQLESIRRGDVPASLWAAVQNIGN